MPMASETLTIIDNRTGKKYEIPIKHGAIKGNRSIPDKDI
jgi:hypothetical protein